MKRNFKVFIFFGLFIFFFILIVIVSMIKMNINSNMVFQKVQAGSLGKIMFKGKVINTSIIKRYGKEYYMICIKLDYTNTNDFYIFNENSGLKIKNGIATMSGGVYIENEKIDYVEINMNNEKKEKFYFKDGSVDVIELLFHKGGLIESDMDLCK